MRIAGLVLLCLLSLGVAGYAAFGYALFPIGALVHPDMRASFEAHRLPVYTHVFAAMTALALGPFQFMRRLRTRRPALHRGMGRVYLGAGVLVGGLAGLVLAFSAYGGTPARIGFGVLALLWLTTGAQAYRAIRAGRVAEHRRWMVRNFALACAAITLRIYVPLSVVAGLPFEVAYAAIAWLCWVPNLVVAELAFVPRTPLGTDGVARSGA